jgi:NAD(P)-dependent dehydrogenase (short-subunit alcohol dehydrogenase family)
MAEPGEIRELFQFVGSEWGKLDCLVNNAGVWLHNPLSQFDEDRFIQTMRIRPTRESTSWGRLSRCLSKSTTPPARSWSVRCLTSEKSATQMETGARLRISCSESRGEGRGFAFREGVLPELRTITSLDEGGPTLGTSGHAVGLTQVEPHPGKGTPGKKCIWVKPKVVKDLRVDRRLVRTYHAPVYPRSESARAT